MKHAALGVAHLSARASFALGCAMLIACGVPPAQERTSFTRENAQAQGSAGIGVAPGMGQPGMPTGGGSAGIAANGGFAGTGNSFAGASGSNNATAGIGGGA